MLPTIKHFKEFKDLLLGFILCPVPAMMNQFPFQRAEEALSGGIVRKHK